MISDYWGLQLFCLLHTPVKPPKVPTSEKKKKKKKKKKKGQKKKKKKKKKLGSSKGNNVLVFFVRSLNIYRNVNVKSNIN